MADATAADGAGGAETKTGSGTTDAAVGKSTDWAAAVKRIRDSNDWIVKAFLALGVALIGSGPLLAHLQGLAFNDRGIAAVVGILVSLLGAGAIAWLASNVNLTELTTIVQLANPDDVRNDPVKRQALTELKVQVEADEPTRWLYLGGADSVSDLIAARRKDVAALRSQTAALASIPATVLGAAGQPEQPNPALAELDGVITQTRANIASYDRLLTWLADWGSYATTKQRFVHNRRLMVGAGAMAFLGLCTWVLALGANLSGKNGEASAGSAKSAAGTPAIGVFKWGDVAPMTLQAPYQAAADALRSQLVSGTRSMAAKVCDKVGVIVEGGSGSAESPWQLSVLPRDPCPVHIRFAADRRLGTVEAFEGKDNGSVTIRMSDARARPTWWVWTVIGLGMIAVVLAALLCRSLWAQKPT